MKQQEVFTQIKAAGILPAVVIDRVSDAVPTAHALLNGGIDVMEITFRTDAAAGSIRNVAEQVPQMLVGAGTVVDVDQCEAAVQSGAQFIVSPGFDEALIRRCIELQVAVIPGCVTPTEIMHAQKLGLKLLKFFPASVYGGLSALKALHGPFPDAEFIPTGGVNTENLAEFLSVPYVFAVGGSWICPKNAVVAGNFDKITALCAEARRAIQ